VCGARYCVNAAISLLEADPSGILCRTRYNVAALSFSPGQLAAEIRKYVPEFECEYMPDFRQRIADSWPQSIDDSVVRSEWGWMPKFDLSSMTRDMMEKLRPRLAEGGL
jgi:nucleoside-diphosphate-sugar epimerase